MGPTPGEPEPATWLLARKLLVGTLEGIAVEERMGAPSASVMAAMGITEMSSSSSIVV